MPLLACVTTIILLEYFAFVIIVGVMRNKTGIKAPAITGSPELERAIRVQQNTLEQLMIVLPSMWIFGFYISEQVSAALGIIFVFGRLLYCKTYLVNPKNRTVGFFIGLLASVVLLLGAIFGSVQALI